MYENKITLKKIKDSLCPKKLDKDFVDQLFDILKIPYMASFFDSYSFCMKHLSEFMKGNYHNGKRMNVRNLSNWAKLICDEGAFNKMIDSISSISEVSNITEDHAVYSLIDLDRDEMPEPFVGFINSSISSGDHSAALTMLVLWSIYGKDQIDLLAPVYSRMIGSKANVREELPLLSNKKICRPVFMGRDDVIAEIDSRFSKSNFVFLEGMGGIGKSECSKQYAKLHDSDYDVMIFAEYQNDIIRLVNDNNTFAFTSQFDSGRMTHPDGTKESDDDHFRRRLTFLRSIACERILIIIDNIDRFDDPLEELLAVPVRFLITTRWHYHNIHPENVIKMKAIGDMTVLKQIFSEYYGKNISGDRCVEEIITMFDGHTMALELIAKQMRASCLTPEEMLRSLSNGTEHELEEGFLMPNYDERQKSITQHMIRLFDIASLNSDEQYILMCLSILPLTGIEKPLFKKMCGLRNLSSVNKLIEYSWINDVEDILTMHTLVKETVQITLAPDLDKCRSFIDGLMAEFTTVSCYHGSQSRKAKVFRYAYNLYQLFPQPSVEHYRFYEWLELMMNHCSACSISAEISGKLIECYKKEFGENNFRAARMVCRLGCAEKEMSHNEKAIEILENGKAMILSLDDLTDRQRLYVSDVNVAITNIYVDCYDLANEPELIGKVEELSREIIEIRSSFPRDKHGAIDDRLLYLAPAYRNLAWIEMLRRDYDKTGEYNRKLVEECEKSVSSYDYFYIEYINSKISAQEGDMSGAVELMNRAVAKHREYRGEKNIKAARLYAELGDLYLQMGDKTGAAENYMKSLRIFEETDLGKEPVCAEVSRKLSEIEKTE